MTLTLTNMIDKLLSLTDRGLGLGLGIKSLALASAVKSLITTLNSSGHSRSLTEDIRYGSVLNESYILYCLLILWSSCCWPFYSKLKLNYSMYIV